MDWATDPGTMIVSMIKSLYKIIEEFPEVIKEQDPPLQVTIYS